MAHTRADKAVATVIDGLADWTYGTNLFHGDRQPTHPSQVVNCIMKGGISPVDLHPPTAEPSDLRPRVQVLIRCKINDADSVADLAETIRLTLHLATIAGYMDCRVAESQPNDLGETEDGHQEWSLNVDLRVSE